MAKKNARAFEFPFNVTDVIYLTSSEKKYCFLDPPEDIEDEISSLNQENLLLKNCPENSISVCFTSGNDCDINVNHGSRYVDKNSERMYFYTNALMYSAIFSEKEIYECQLKRVMQRGEQLTLLYLDKAEFISREGCNTNLNQELLELSNLERGFSGSENFNNYIISLTENLKTRNKIAECRLW